MLKKLSLPKLDYLTTLLGAFILTIPALINRFPFIYSDTGTYVGVGFNDGISYIRPLAYGVFLRHASMKESMFLVVFIQAWLVVGCMRLFLKYFFPDLSRFFLPALVALLTTCTSIGVTTGMLMPDFTTPFLFLIVSLWLFTDKLHWSSRVFTFIVLWFTLANHHSHAYILFLMLAGLAFFKLVTPVFKSVAWTRIVVLFGILCLGYFSIPGAHYLKKGEFVASKSRNVFLVSRFHQMGLLKDFLDHQCPAKGYTLCQYREDIPKSFLWDPASPLQKDGGWIPNNTNYAPVVRDFFQQPKYLHRFAIKSIETTFQQLFFFKTVALDPMSRNQWPQMVFEDHLPHLVPAIENSLQNRREWNNQWLDWRQSILVFAAMLNLLWFFFYQKRYPVRARDQQLVLFLLLLLLANAAICGGISMLAARFQARIIWLVPFFTLALGWMTYQKYHSDKLNATGNPESSSE
ncbi:MAG: hypothetical protein AAF828_08995 [Bacteroidota bacterium]